MVTPKKYKVEIWKITEVRIQFVYTPFNLFYEIRNKSWLLNYPEPNAENYYIYRLTKMMKSVDFKNNTQQPKACSVKKWKPLSDDITYYLSVSVVEIKESFCEKQIILTYLP